MTKEIAEVPQASLLDASSRDASRNLSLESTSLAFASLGSSRFSGDSATLGGASELPTHLSFDDDDIFKSSVSDFTPLGERGGIDALSNGQLSTEDESGLSKNTATRLNGILGDLRNGDISTLRPFVWNMGLETDSAQRDMQRGLDALSAELATKNITATSESGSFTLTLPEAAGEKQSLTIDREGNTSLQGEELKRFEDSLSDVITNKGFPPMSLEGLSQTQQIIQDIKKNDIGSLGDALQSIGEQIGRAQPGAAGDAARRVAAETRDVVSLLSTLMDRSSVSADFDENSNSFAIEMLNANGAKEMLTIDKFGRSSLGGEQLQRFLTQLNSKLSVQPPPDPEDPPPNQG